MERERETYAPPKNIGELLERYHNGERHFTGLDFAQDDNSYFDLRNVTLEGADFSHSWILADFRGANLRGVYFHACLVKVCDFRDADLTGANFTDAAIDGANFEGAMLDDADFTGASSYGYTFQPSDMPQT